MIKGLRVWSALKRSRQVPVSRSSGEVAGAQLIHALSF